MPAPTVDSSREYRISWLTAQVFRYEARLANTRAVLINEKMVPDLQGDHAEMFNEYENQQDIVLSASLSEKRAKLKCLLPDSTALIDAVFEETDEEDKPRVLKELEMYPTEVLMWLENGLGNWSRRGGRSLNPPVIINEILDSLRELALNFTGVRTEPALSLMLHYDRVWKREERQN